MAKRPITNELYNALLQSFRQYPAEYARAGRAAACDSRTASRAWHQGWVKQNPNWAPISKVLEEEQLSARAQMQNQTAVVAEQQRTAESLQMQAEREKAAADALEARGQEAQMVRILRTDVTNQLAAVARLLPGMGKWTQWAAETMKDSDPKSIRDVTKMMDAISKVTERTATAADRVMAMERRLLGQPEMVVGHVMAEITMEEAVEHIEASARTLEYAREAGLLPPAEHSPNSDEDAIDAEVVDSGSSLPADSDASSVPSEAMLATG